MSIARKYQRPFTTAFLAAAGMVLVGAGLQPDTKPKAPAAQPEVKPAVQPAKPGAKPQTPVAQVDLPTVEQIMEKNIEATGGKANWAKVKTQHTKSTMEAKAFGLKGPVHTWRGESGKYFSEVDLESFGKMQEGSDGDTVWIVEPSQGPRILDGEEREMKLSISRLDNPVDWQKLFKKTEVVGAEKVGDSTTFKVVCTLAVGDQTLTQYFDKESGLLVKMSMVEKGPHGEIAVDVFPSDFKEVSGVKLPYKTVRNVMNFEFIETVEKIDINVEIPKDKFDLPKDIKELKDAAKAATPKPDAAPATPTPPSAKPEKK
ncbi:MAG: DUF620 domain-containing protein [Pyrinomonadaceae bacterium]|nr:DUF620 domain-containing protein [Phycisphaerales bacterium]